jgi:hypothetical protein
MRLPDSGAVHCASEWSYNHTDFLRAVKHNSHFLFTPHLSRAWEMGVYTILVRSVFPLAAIMLKAEINNTDYENVLINKRHYFIIIITTIQQSRYRPGLGHQRSLVDPSSAKRTAIHRTAFSVVRNISKHHLRNFKMF